MYCDKHLATSGDRNLVVINQKKQMNIQKYIEKKEKNLVEVVSVGNATALVSKRFDQDTGDELDSEIISLNREELEKQRDRIKDQLDSLDALLADMDSTKPVKSQNVIQPA